jgi:ribosome-associated heat shock protein Hsp15
LSPSPGPDDGDAPDGPATPGSQRLDKWLWCARVMKSRTQAAGLVSEGHVRVNRVKVDKPSLALKRGDVLTITIGRHLRVLQVAAFGTRRGPASEARLLFEDLTPPPSPPGTVPGTTEQREPGSGRPTKRDRRLMDRLKGE